MHNNDLKKASIDEAAESKANFSSDLPDTPHDEQRLQPEEVILDLPDVKDIPGQENIIPPKMNMFADTTIASDDEEGLSIFGEEITEEDDIS